MPGLPFRVTYGFAVIFSMVGGLLPSTVLVALPEFVDTTRDLMRAAAVRGGGRRSGARIAIPCDRAVRSDISGVTEAAGRRAAEFLAGHANGVIR